MNRTHLLLTVALSAVLSLCLASRAEDRKPVTQPDSGAATQPAGDLAPLPLVLPKPAYKETPRDIPPGIKVEKPRAGARPPFLAPKGCVNLALNRPVTGSDKDPIIGSLKLITDSDKEATEGSYVELGPGVQWVQIDLGKPCTLYALALWHYHGQARVYHDVVVQVSDDPDFIKGVHTLFNNDHDNSAGLGAGESLGYWEHFEGKIIDAKGVKARYLRCYSNGNTSDDQNHYTEVEAWGLPDSK